MSEHLEHDDRWADLVAGYALDALDPEQGEVVERHLGECRRCAARLRWYAPAVDVLPESVAHHDPPPELRERLLATVYAEAEAEATSAQRSDRRTASRTRVREWLGGLLARPAYALAVVALVVAIGGATGWIARGGEEADPRTVSMETVAPRLSTDASLAIHDDHAVLTATGLPAIPEDEVFQVWLARGEEIIPSTVFVSGPGGRAKAAIDTPLEGVERVMVTREPSGGSRRPTTSPFLSSDV